MPLEVFFIDCHHHVDHLARGYFWSSCRPFVGMLDVAVFASTPSEAAINCIAGITCSAGRPLVPEYSELLFGEFRRRTARRRRWRCSRLRPLPSQSQINAQRCPAQAKQKFLKFLFTIVVLAGDVTTENSGVVSTATKSFESAKAHALISPRFASAVMRSAARNASASIVMVAARAGGPPGCSRRIGKIFYIVCTVVRI